MLGSSFSWLYLKRGRTMRDTATVIHRNSEGSPDYVIVLTFEFSQELNQWVGLCLELGASAFADTFEQAQLELRESVELQLNEMEKLTETRLYLSKKNVRIVAIDSVATPGFAVAQNSG